MKTKIIEKYKELFNEEKPFYDILQESKDLLNISKDLSFKISDFKEDLNYEKNLNTIKLYRKYIELDSFINNTLTDDKALILYGTKNRHIDYKIMVAALEKFKNEVRFEDISFTKNEFEKRNSIFDVIEITSVNDFFGKNQYNYCIYNIKSNKIYYLCYNYKNYDFIIKINFENLEEIDLVSCYTDLLKKYIRDNFEKFNKDKIYTTIYKEFGETFEKFREFKKEYDSKFYTYTNTIEPFLKNYKDETYFYDFSEMCMSLGSKVPLNFYINNTEEENIIQETKYREYFRNLQYSKELIQKYCEENWIKAFDIGILIFNILIIIL